MPRNHIKSLNSELHILHTKFDGAGQNVLEYAYDKELIDWRLSKSKKNLITRVESVLSDTLSDIMKLKGRDKHEKLKTVI